MKSLLTAAAAFTFFALLAAGAHRYSTLLESLMREPLVREWQGPAEFRVGETAAWEKVDVPRADMSKWLGTAKPGDKAQYRFAVSIPPELQKAGEAIAFSPNWVVHRTWRAYVDGAWVATGHGLTASGDIVYQKVVLPLPAEAVARGTAEVVIEADVTPGDIGIQHLAKIILGPAPLVGRLHVEAEYAMGSYYLLFLTAAGALFIFFALVYLLAETRPGFGTFVVYAFLTTVIHLAIGNFLEGIIPFGPRVWVYFLAKGAATTALGIFLARVLFNEGLTAKSVAVFLVPTLLPVGMMLASAEIPAMHKSANIALFLVVAGSLGRAALRRIRPGVVAFGGLYLAFLAWNFFVHTAQDFDYRPLADLAFYYFVAWLTVSELGVAQARARILEGNFQRLYGFAARLLGRKLTEHLVIRGEAHERAERDVAVMVVDVRHTNRLMRRHGSEAVLAALDEIVGVVAEIVERRGGEVNKIMGDKVVAYWGLTDVRAAKDAGEALRDAAGRAMAAAQAVLDVRERLHALNARRLGDQAFLLHWASGLACGTVTAGRIGSGTRTDYGAFGAPVNAAFAAAALAKEEGFDCILDLSLREPLADRLLVEPFADDSFALLAAFDQNGTPRFAEPRWAERFATEKPGVVYDAGANQASFVPAIVPQRKAA